MSVNYQTDSYILYNESICNNQIKHQELLVSTFKQLAEENKRLLKERERFEHERSERNLEISSLKKNLINLIAVAQYEANRPAYMKSEFMDENKFHDALSKRIEINYKSLKSVNFTQVLNLKFLQQLIKNNFREKDYSNHESTFDCRPYKGPKTPPTPNSKYRFNSSYVNKNHHHLNNFKIKPAHSWNIRDMLYYLKKYKEIFQIYRKTVDQNNSFNFSEKSQFLPICNNVYTSTIQEKNRNIIDKTSSNDMEFYQDLIEKHNKSLAMIENVGTRVHPTMDFSKTPEMQLNALLKDYIIATNSMSELFNINQIYNSLSSQFLMKNPLLMADQMQFSISNELLGNNSNEIYNPAILQPFHIGDSGITPPNEELIEKSENKSEQVTKAEVSIIENEMNEIINKTNGTDEIEAQNNFEDGEIVDSGEESIDKKNIIKIDNPTESENKENKKDKRNKKSCKVSLKSVVTGKLKKSVHDPLKLSSKTGSLCSRYQRKALKTDPSKSNRPVKTLASRITERLTMKHEEPHSTYYSSEERRNTRQNRNEGDRNVKDRVQLSRHRHANHYFHKTRQY